MTGLRAALTGRRLAGTVISFPDPVLAELVAEPFDLVWLDLEHGALDVGHVPGLAVGARAAGAFVLVRLPTVAPERISPILDAGVDGVVIPRVTSPGAAAAAVRALRYPPAGVRGFGPRRGGSYGRAAAAEVVCLVQIEDAVGVRAAAEIAAVEGVEGLIAGPADLALDPAVEDCAAAVGAIVSAARAAGVAPGVASTDPTLTRLLRGGPGMVVHGVDCRLYARAADEAAAAARETWA